MKSVSGGLAAHLALETTTLCTCWKVTRTDAAVYGFTDHVVDLVIGGVTYAAQTGYTPSAVQTSAGFEVDNLSVLGVLDASIVTPADLRAGRWDFAAVEIFKVNYRDLTQGTLKLRKGTLGEVRHGRLRFEAELRGLAQRLAQALGRVYTPACDADLGDARCAVDLGVFSGGTISGSLTAVSSKVGVTDASIVQAAGWFTGGKITLTSGQNSGLAVEVKSHATGGVLTLQEPMPYLPVVGDTYTMTAGCDKSLATCRDKFANVVNFRGHAFLPGVDRMVSGK
jgi:uncharacterized phage protein (TIGR02218 family)